MEIKVNDKNYTIIKIKNAKHFYFFFYQIFIFKTCIIHITNNQFGLKIILYAIQKFFTIML